MNATTRADAGPSTRTLLRLAAIGGRSDRLRIALTAIGSAAATITLLTAAAVAFISSNDGPYGPNVLDEAGLRPGVMIAILLLCVPLVVFVGLCTRVGAPARDRRLAMIRMAGATPGEATRLAAYETGIAAFIGSIIGTAVFFLGRPLLDSTTFGSYSITNPDGSTNRAEGLVRSLPTDVHIPIPAVVAVVAAIALGATVASAAAMRKIRIGPFGVTRSTPTSPPTKTAASLFAGGTAGLVALGLTAQATQVELLPLTLAAFVLFVLSVVGLLMGSASIAATAGRWIAPRVSRPDLLIASRRLVAAPYTASRATTSILLAVLIGGAMQGTRASFLAGTDPSDTFYADTFALIDGVLAIAIVLATASLLITSAEAIVERRRTLAALVAGGTPRPVVARAAMLESLIPLVPSVLLAATAGLLAARGFFPTNVERLATFELNGSSDMITVGVPVPWDRLAVLCGGTIAASIAITALSLLFLGRSTRMSELRTAA